MNNLFKKIAAAFVGMAMAIGVGVALGKGSMIKSAKAEEFSAQMIAGTNGSECTVNEKSGIKVGTSKAGGDMSITVGSGAETLHLYAAAWKGVNNLSLNFSGATTNPTSIALSPDDGISNNTPFTLSGSEDNFKFDISLSNITSETTISIASSAAKRFVVWGATYEVGGSGQGEQPTSVESVALDKASAKIEIGEELALAATISPANATNKAVSWASNNEEVATVDEDGIVTGLKVGQATITVTTEDGNKTDSCEIEVVNRNYGSLNEPLTIAEANALFAELDLKDGEYTNKAVYITGTVKSHNAYSEDFGSYSKDFVITDETNDFLAYHMYIAEGVLELTEELKAANGLVGYEVTLCGLVKNYKGTIEMAQNSDKTINPTIVAASAPVPTVINVESVSLDEQAIELEVEETQTLVATVLPEDAADKSVTWSSDDESVATVSQQGLVTAVAEGTANIIVTTTDGGKTASCAVTVKAKTPVPPTTFTVSFDANGGTGKVADVEDISGDYELPENPFNEPENKVRSVLTSSQ